MTGYHIVEEQHSMGGGGRDMPITLFHYAIKRGDGSIVFRAGTYDHARELLDRLLVTTKAA